MISIKETQELLDEIAESLPSEFYNGLNGGILLLPEEKPYCIKVLKAAGMTYLASAAIAVVQLLRLMSIKGRRR